MTEVTAPLVAVKLEALTVPTTASSKVAVKVMASLVAVDDVASVTVVIAGAFVSMAWLSSVDKLALATALPVASVNPVPTKLSATLPLAVPAVGVTTTVYTLDVPTWETEDTVPLVAVKLEVLTVPTTASSKVAVKVMASLVTLAVVASETDVMAGALVSMPWLSKVDRLALATALPTASVKPVPTKLSATLPLAKPGVGVTTTV